MSNTPVDEEINERFKGGARHGGTSVYWQWTLTQYEYYGATNYVSLVKDYRYGPDYRLLIETDSGYSKPFLAGTYNERDVLRVIEGFPPTNPDFKTDRK